MKEKPIIFNGPMVRAILGGRKTQTRRPVKHVGNAMHYGKILGAWSLSKPPRQYVEGERLWRWMGKNPPKAGDWIWYLQTAVDDTATFPMSTYQIGDHLWVRETFGLDPDSETPFYRATEPHLEIFPKGYWKPSIHMPRWASRITLEVTGIRVERVQEISFDDCYAEGVDTFLLSAGVFNVHGSPFHRIHKLWDSIYAKTYPWDSNPWVWVIEFTGTSPPTACPKQ